MSAAFPRRSGAAAFSPDAEGDVRPATRQPVVFSWHESSLELRRGLEIVELESLDAWPAPPQDPEPAGA